MSAVEGALEAQALTGRLHELTRTDEVPTVETMIELVDAFYRLPGNEVGGSLHIVLDDENVEKRHLIWCQGYAAGRGDEIGHDLALLLERMKKSHRRLAARRGMPWMR